MERIALTERADWKSDADRLGLTIHSMDGERYWDERNAYVFKRDEVADKLHAPTRELLSMCYAAVDKIVTDGSLMTRIGIPSSFHEAVRSSWKNGEKDLYGRFDFSYDGNGPAKLLEFNCDTPSALLESALMQKAWLAAVGSSVDPAGFQFNRIDEALREAFARLCPKGSMFHFCAATEAEEDLMTTRYLEECARAAGAKTKLLDISDLGVDAHDWLTDLEDYRIERLFKFYPIEEMMRDEFGAVLRTTPTKMFEPLWKAILSNKALLVVLWEMYPGHPNLLPAYFEDDASDLAQVVVRKPLFGRQGDQVTIASDVVPTNAQSDMPFIVQNAKTLPRFGNDYALVCTWVVAGEPVGLCVLEDDTPITTHTSRFVPHIVVD